MIIKLSHLYAGCTTGSTKGQSENRDCCVRALSIAHNMHYDEAHSLFKKWGREDKHGTYDMTIHKALREAGASTVESRGAAVLQHGITLQQFLKMHPKGRFFVVRKGHAFAVVDGVVHDWWHGTGPRSRIRFAYQLPGRS